jgi:hypothetical protein
MSGPTPHVEREKLISRYYRAAKAYSEAVSELVRIDAGSFAAAYEKAETARKECEVCRAAIVEFEKKS